MGVGGKGAATRSAGSLGRLEPGDGGLPSPGAGSPEPGATGSALEPWRSALQRERDATLSRLVDLSAELEAIVAAAGGSNGDDEHDPEGATVAFERQRVVALVSATRTHLAQLDAASARLDAGGGACCALCGEPIGSERLEALPAVTCCARCVGLRASEAVPVGRRPRRGGANGIGWLG